MPDQTRNEIDAEFRDIFEMCCEKGFMAATYESMMEQLDDQCLVQLVKNRQKERSVKVSLDEL